MPDVAEALHQQGFTIADSPRLVTADDTKTADFVITIGCDAHDITADNITEWDPPLLSEDFTGSMEAIHHCAERLAHQLARRHTTTPPPT